MPKLTVRKTIDINTDLENVKTIVTDFSQGAWSPWLTLEPTCKLNIKGTKGEVGHMYNWDGEIVGAGEMSISKIQNNRVDFDLFFLKPFKSKAKVYFEFEKQKNSTKVSWGMDSSLPWFMFFLKKMMVNMIGMDYERGLKMLKEYTETGKVASKLELDNNSSLENMQYVGLENKCHMKDIGDVMQKDFKTLMSFAKASNIGKDALYFSIYHKLDMSENIMSFTSAIKINSDFEVKAPFVKSKIQKSKAIKVTHTGKYEYLGNAWSLIMMYSKAKKLKIHKKPMGYEFYINNNIAIDHCDYNADTSKMITDLHVALK